MAIWPTIERFLAGQGAAALVTLADTQGSSPREAGARMVVAPDGAFTGTIGGGVLEWNALAEAQALIARRDPVTRLDKALGPDLGQCCGGRVTVLIERFDAGDRVIVEELARREGAGVLVTAARLARDGRLARAPADPADAAALPADADYRRLADGRVIERFGAEPTPFYLFGAGHVGHALAAALGPLPFLVSWIDGRPGAFPASFPVNVTCIAESDPVALLARAPQDAFIAVMTHSHALDLDLVIAALNADRFAYVGLIGSATKRARFTSAMAKMGMAQRTIDSLVCPIGLTAIRDKAPAAIAASVVAQVLIVRDEMLARAHGHDDVAGHRVTHG